MPHLVPLGCCCRRRLPSPVPPVHSPCTAALLAAVKSNNVLLNSQGVAKLADVGLARMQASGGPSVSPVAREPQPGMCVCPRRAGSIA